MNKLILSKHYTNINLVLLFFSSICGLAYFLWLEKIQNEILFKAWVVILAVPFVSLYLAREFYRVYFYPNQIILDFDSELIDIGENKSLKLAQLKYLLIKAKQGRFLIFIETLDGEKISFKNYFSINLETNEIDEKVRRFSNINFDFNSI
jgi:hypothetical protein